MEGKFSYCFLCCVNFAQAHFYIKECSLTVSKFLITTGSPESQAVKSEILDLSNSGNQQCPLWMDYPINVLGATGALIGEKAIICGGDPYTDECHVITATNAQLLSKMTNKRSKAASAKITSTSFIVTGGHDGANILSSTEIINSDGSVTPGPELPLPL